MRRDAEHYGAASLPRGAPAAPFARLILPNAGDFAASITASSMVWADGTPSREASA